MKKIIMLSALALTVVCQNAMADVNPNRVLRCNKNQAALSIPACGGATCVATIKKGTVTTKYTVARTRQSNGAFIYSTKAGKKPSCTVYLTKGNFGVKSITCVPELTGASCLIS